MADQPDPPDKWRVYEGDSTPDPEPQAPAEPPQVPYGQVPYGSATPHVPYGGHQAHSPVFVTTTSSSGVRKFIFLFVALGVLGAVVAGAVAIFASVGTDVIGDSGGTASVDPKQPEDFARMVEDLEEKTGSTQVFSVGLYDGYAIAYVPVDASTKSVAYRWDGAGIAEWTKSTSTEARFDVAEIKPDVIEGMCDPVLELAEGATPGDCYVQIRKPYPGSEGWFSAGASDDYGRYFSVMYDKKGVEVSRTVP